MAAYPGQVAVLGRLERVLRRHVRGIEDSGAESLRGLWRDAQARLEDGIFAAYRRDFKGRAWTFPEAKTRGTLDRIQRVIAENLAEFRVQSTSTAAMFLKRVRREEALGAAWLLDQTTPPSVRIRLPMAAMTRESGIQVYTGAAAAVVWSERWAHWVNAYERSLGSNILLGAINASTAEDAAAEVAATTAGTPAMDIFKVLLRIFTTEAIGTGVEARQEITDLNGNVVLAEVWQTLEDMRVCDICDPNNGLEREDVEDDIPAHPNCRCFWRVVPKSWADMLQSDPDTARERDRRGVVPDAMAIWDPKEQELVGATMVDFEQWKSDRMQGVSIGL